MNHRQGAPIVDHVSELVHLELGRNPRHKLIDIIVLPACVVGSARETWEGIENYRQFKGDRLKRFLGFPTAFRPMMQYGVSSSGSSRRACNGAPFSTDDRDGERLEKHRTLNPRTWQKRHPRARTGYAAEICAIVGSMALSIMKRDTQTKRSLKARPEVT